MPIICIKCKDSITKEDSIQCVTCKKNLHSYCAGYSEVNFKKLSSNTKSRFSCEYCLLSTSKAKLKMDLSPSKDNKLEEIITSMKFMSDQFDSFNSKIDSVLNEIKTLKAENSKITLENMKLNNEIDSLKIKIDELEQYNLRNCIEIKGIPKTLNENCSDIIQSIAKKVNCNVIINSAYRIVTKENNSGILIAEINSLEMKNDLLRKIKKIKLNANMVANAWSPDVKIFCNERLTKFKRLLFAKTRTICKEKQYKYVWTNNAEVLVRKDDGSKIVKIKSEFDINKL